MYFSAGKITINPQNPIPLAGHASRVGVYQKIDSDLEVNGVLLQQGKSRCILLSFDTLFLSENFQNQLYQRFSHSDCDLVLAATHSHFTPMLDETKPHLGKVDLEYFHQVLNSTEQLVNQLLTAPKKKVCIEYVKVEGNHAVYRRKKTGWLTPRISMLPNLSGPTDPYLRAFRFLGEEGELLCFLWNYACHPVSYHHPLHISAEFPGNVRLAIRERSKKQMLPVLYFQGFSGNLRPPSYASLPNKIQKWPRYFAKQVLKGQHFEKFNQTDYNCWSDRVVSTGLQAAFSEKGQEISPQLKVFKHHIPLHTLLEKQQAEKKLEIVCLQLSHSHQLLGFSAEVAVEYRKMIEKLFPNIETLSTGCLAGTYGYLPTDQMIREGGYEAQDFFSSFSLEGKYRNHVESTVIAALQAVKNEDFTYRL